MKTKLPFLTEAFYQWPHNTESVFNQLVQKKLTAEFDMYKSGTFLFMSAKDCPETREVLAEVISDIEQYKAHFDGHYTAPKEGSICLCGLQDFHENYFGSEEAIMWDEERRSFFSAKAFFNDEDEYELD